MISDVTKSSGKFISQTKDTVTKEGAARSRLLPKGTLILSNSGTVCVPKILAVDGCIHDGFVAFPELTSEMEMLYLFHYFDHIRSRMIQENRQGVTQVNLNTSIVKNIDIPVPPFAEQQRIVSKIEELLTQLDAGIDELRKARAQLKRYRQAVLKAAVTGELTKEWREAHQAELEPASELLARILKERRSKWEADQLAKMLAAAVKPKSDQWKGKYRHPASPQSDKTRLPDGWVWCTWDQISNWVTYGFTRPMPHVEQGPPIVTAKNISHGRIDFGRTHKTSDTAFEELSEKDCPRRDDILITKDGAIGRAAVVDTDIPFCINQSVAVVWLRSCPLDRRFLLRVIESALTQKPIEEKARGSAIQHLSITDFAKLEFPLPSLLEERKIAEEVDRAFSIVDFLEETLTDAFAYTSRMRQSILKQAFEGKLVAQDPNEEPAEVLLERIKIERAKSEAERRPAAKPRRRRAARVSKREE